MTYSDAALAAILDAKADQLRDEKHAPEVVLELATLLGDMDEVTISSVASQEGLERFVPDNTGEMSCDECGDSTGTPIPTLESRSARTVPEQLIAHSGRSPRNRSASRTDSTAWV